MIEKNKKKRLDESYYRPLKKYICLNTPMEDQQWLYKLYELYDKNNKIKKS